MDESGEKARGGPRGGAPPPSARAHLTLAAVRMRRPPAPPHPRLHSALFRPSALPARTPPVPQVRMTGGRVGEIPGHSWKLLSGWAGKKARTLRTNTSFSRRPQQRAPQQSGLGAGAPSLGQAGPARARGAPGVGRSRGRGLRRLPRGPTPRTNLSPRHWRAWGARTPTAGSLQSWDRRVRPRLV